MGNSRFEVYFSKGHDWRWRLKASNGEIVAVSEGYTTKDNAKRGAVSAKNAAFFATITEL